MLIRHAIIGTAINLILCAASTLAIAAERDEVFTSVPVVQPSALTQSGDSHGGRAVRIWGHGPDCKRDR